MSKIDRPAMVMSDKYVTERMSRFLSHLQELYDIQYDITFGCLHIGHLLAVVGIRNIVGI